MVDSHLVNSREKSAEQLILIQTHFEAVIQFTNITMNGGGLSIIIESPSYSVIVIDHLIANNTSDDIYFRSSWDRWAFGNQRTSVMYSYSHFTNYTLVIEKGKGRPTASESEKSMIALSHIQIERSHHPLEWTNIKMLLGNTTITDNFGKFQLTLQAVVLQIQGVFIFQRNNGGIELVPHDDDGNSGSGCILFINGDSKVFFKDNIITRQGVGSVLYARNSYICVDNSTIIFNGNSGVISGGMTLINSSFSVEGISEASFSHNSGSTGGAIAFSEQSKLRLFDTNIRMCFTENHASKFYIFKQYCSTIWKCSLWGMDRCP